MSNMNINFGPILSIGQSMQNWPPVLEKHVAMAMSFSIAGLQADAKSGAPYKDGNLYGNIQPYVFSPFKAMVYTDLPYSWRQEEGFTGMTDSRGRYFPNYPGTHYMRKALSKNKGTIRAAFESEVYAAIAEVTGSGSATGIMGWII